MNMACFLMLLLFVAGMLDLKHAQEWVVTTKLGSSDKRPGTQMPTVPVRTCRFYAAEVMFSFFVLASASYGIFSVNKWSFSIFLTLQGRPHYLLTRTVMLSLHFVKACVSCHKHCCQCTFGHSVSHFVEEIIHFVSVLVYSC